MNQNVHDHHWLTTTIELERPRIVGLRAHLTGDVSAAVDLAQETCIEALRNFHKLHDRDGVSRWLSAIERNICLRWRQQQGRTAAHRIHLERIAPASGEVDEIAAVDDLDVDLERAELADLLDRALDRLAPETRAIVIARYIAESPHAEIAARLGMSTGAVKMRLKRGTLSLRRVLAAELGPAASAYGLVVEPTAAIFDSRTLSGSVENGARGGYDGAKKRKGSKLHLAVDTLGEYLALVVSPADEGDRAQIEELAAAVQEATGDAAELAYVDQGYTGKAAALDVEGWGIRLVVVKLPEARGVRALAAPLGGRALLRLAEPVSATGQGLRATAGVSGRAASGRLLRPDAREGHETAERWKSITPSSPQHYVRLIPRILSSVSSVD